LQSTFIHHFRPKVSFTIGFLRWVWVPRRLLSCSDRHRDFLLAEQLGFIAAGRWKADLLVLLIPVFLAIFTVGRWVLVPKLTHGSILLKLVQVGFVLSWVGSLPAYIASLFALRKARAHGDEIAVRLLGGPEALLDGILWRGEVFGYGLTKLTEDQRTRLRRIGYLSWKDRNTRPRQDSQSDRSGLKEGPRANGSTLKWLRESLLLIVTPGIAAYALTYLHAAGYSFRFGIPWHFVSPNSSDIAEYLVVLSLLVSAPFVALNAGLTGPFRDIDYPVGRRVDFYPRRHLLRLGLFFLFTFLTRIYVHPPRLVFWLVVLGLGVGLLPEWIETFTEISASIKSKRLSLKIQNNRAISLFDLPGRRLRIDVFTPVVFLVLAAVFGFMKGYYEAYRQRWFLTPARFANTVVLLNYGDRIVTEQFNPATKVIIPTLQVLKSEDEILKWQKIGQLKPPKNGPSD
jgi:hypothetical protein